MSLLNIQPLNYNTIDDYYYASLEENNDNSSVSLINERISINSSNKSSDCSSVNNQCRICLEEVFDNQLKRYCDCIGSAGNVHKHCLLEWILTSGKTSCEICNRDFIIVREYKIDWYKIIGLLIIFMVISSLFIYMMVKNSDRSMIIVFLLFTIGAFIYVFSKELKQLYILKSINILEITE